MRYRLSHLLIAIVIVSFLVCFVVQPHFFPRYDSEWIVDEKECPERISHLVDEMKKLPPRCTYDALVTSLKSRGFDVDRDHYKDLVVHWNIDGGGLDSRRFVLSMTLWPMLDGEIFDARISEAPENGGWAEIWRISYRELTAAG